MHPGHPPSDVPTGEPHASRPASSQQASSTPSSSSRRAREAERRQVTVLVCGCDLFESEAYLEDLDAEDQAKVLRAFQQACEQAVRQFDGTVVQCNEQGLLACFGYPVAYEDAAHRAARTGLGILEDMKALGERLRREHKLELNPWVGIHTGPAVVETGEDAVSLVGEARNVAVRLEDVAEPGQIVMHRGHAPVDPGPVRLHQPRPPQDQGRGTARRALPGAGSRRGPQPHRGGGAGRAHAADRPRPRDQPAQGPLGAGPGGHGPGRPAHRRAGPGQVAPGVHAEGARPGADGRRGGGRARHRVALLAALPEQRAVPGHRLLRAGPRLRPRGAAAGPVRPAAPPPGAVRPGPAGDRAAVGVAAVAADHGPLPAARRCPPARQREETFRAMLEWLHTRAARRPVLFVVEDLHWVDASTLEFLGQFLAEGLHDSDPDPAHLPPRVPDALARGRPPDQPGPEPPDAAPGRRPDAEEDGGALPEAVVEQVYDRAGGVPLFVEEFTKMVQESGVLDQAGEGGARAKALLAREIPATLQDLVMARLDRMEGDREVAQLAATLGREFSYELLAAVATVDEPTLQAELAKLVQAEILYPKGRPPRCTYIFKHALLEDALYNALVKGKRQQFHRRIAEALEARFPQTVATQPELLAHHFTEAGLTEKAIGYWLKAGLRSRERSAEIEAIGHLTRGLALLETLDESPERDARELELLSPLGTAYIASRGYAAAGGRPGLPPGARAVRADRAAAAALRDHAGHLGVAHRPRRSPAVHGPGRRGDGIRRPAQRPRHHDGSVVHGG